MVNENIGKLPQTYTVSYFNENEWNKDLTSEELSKTDEIAELEYRDRLLNSSQYGPSEGKSGKSFNQTLINEINDNDSETKKSEADFKVSASKGSVAGVANFGASAGASSGSGGAIAHAGAEASLFQAAQKPGNVDAKILAAKLNSEVGAGPGGAVAKVEAGVNLIDAKAEGFHVKVGLNADTGGSVGLGGVEVKVLGTGVSIGKETGVSTPFGSFSVNIPEAVDSIKQIFE